MSEFRYQFKMLSKPEKEWIDLATEEAAIDVMSRPEYQPMYAHIVDVMRDLMADEYEMNADQIAFMMVPYKVFGRHADKQLAIWLQSYWKKKKANK